ncbi:creatininase family protein [Rhizobium sp. RCAM05973]|uniref:creatininase family protein n=1 Tax=Rhizobium sp. RCAM05973 TaxID=2994066 RepID=UPI0022EBE0F3|nr:creatininase family protein [Rhizobium sp. RCAM05973]
MTRAIEMLRPSQIRSAFEECSLVYLPLGTIEWHCEHLPVGLDALTARDLCLLSAEVTGGLVWPALYYGTGGDHGSYPWTVMMESSEHLAPLLRKTLNRLAELKVERIVLFSGHFAGDQLDMIDQLKGEFEKLGPMKVLATAVNRFNIPDFPQTMLAVSKRPSLRGFGPRPSSSTHCPRRRTAMTGPTVMILHILSGA